MRGNKALGDTTMRPRVCVSQAAIPDGVATIVPSYQASKSLVFNALSTITVNKSGRNTIHQITSQSLFTITFHTLHSICLDGGDLDKMK